MQKAIAAVQRAARKTATPGEIAANIAQNPDAPRALTAPNPTKAPMIAPRVLMATMAPTGMPR